MFKRTTLPLWLSLTVVFFGLSTTARSNPIAATARMWGSFVARAIAPSDREQDGLVGPVRRVKTETARISVKNGKPVEGARAVMETTTYDNKGNRVDNAYFLAAGGSLTGKEVYKYDDKGNIVEMTLHNEDGSLLSKEVYTYEFDSFGNWTKMTTSVAVLEGGKVNYEPTEITYRTIAYYLEEATVVRLSQPAAPSAAASSVRTQPAQTPDVKANAAVAANGAGAAASSVTKPTPAEAEASRTTTKNVPASPMIAALDKSSVVAPVAPIATPNASASGSAAVGGPVIKADGDAPEAVKPRGPLKPVSGGILNGKAVSLPAPVYPEIAKRAHALGIVEVEVVIDVTGKVISAKAVRGHALLQDAAERAAMQARFSPTLLSGQPVKVTGFISYNFNMGQ